MVSSSYGKMEVEKFNGTNFQLWKLKMEDMLEDHDLWEVTSNAKRPATIAQEDWDIKDRKAKGLIRLCLTDVVLLNVLDEKTANSLWERLAAVYHAKSLVNKLFLRKKLYSLRMEEGGSLTDHLNSFNLLAAQLTSAGVKLEEEDHCYTLLCSLPDSWDHLVMALGSTLVTFKMDDVVSSLLSEEMSRKASISEKEGLAIRGRSTERGKKNDNKSDNKGRSKPRGKSKTSNKSKEKCWNCDKSRHFCKDCKELKKKKKKGSDSASERSQEDGDAFIVALAAHASDDVWSVDSGEYFHMTSH